MQYINTRDPHEKVSFREATLQGLAGNKGLYVPGTIPVLEPSFFNLIESLDEKDLAVRVLWPFVQDSLSADDFRMILTEILSFPFPVRHIEDELYTLELFHGPTQSFKDLGARFMSRCLSHFAQGAEGIRVLVATSGDTGSAVAHGFYKVKGVTVTILFPKGKISSYQEHQMTSLGGNIRVLEVDGTFDDCQALVKQAFQDEELNRRMQLCSANSINVARLLPQMLYYFFAYKQLRKKLGRKKWIVSVPSGNFGNLTAGLLAKKMGLPVHRFIAANNANDTFYRYWQTGIYTPKPSVLTYSNAMDVGAPSNFDRILYLYGHSHKAITGDIGCATFSDRQTLEEIRETYLHTSYTLDPHGAVGLLALKESMDEKSLGLFLETAHPKKFGDVVQKAIPSWQAGEVRLDHCYKSKLENSYQEFRKKLTGDGN